MKIGVHEKQTKVIDLLEIDLLNYNLFILRNELMFDSKWKINHWLSSNCCNKKKYVIRIARVQFTNELLNKNGDQQQINKFTYQISKKFQSYKYGSSGVCLNIFDSISYWNRFSCTRFSNSQKLCWDSNCVMKFWNW